MTSHDQAVRELRLYAAQVEMHLAQLDFQALMQLDSGALADLLYAQRDLWTLRLGLLGARDCAEQAAQALLITA